MTLRVRAVISLLEERNRILEAEGEKLRAALPDCRTCKYLHTSGGAQWCERIHSYNPRCIEGDQHHELPPVRLWRTT